jgi:predicted PurR-regulated permease PerM
MNNPGINMDTQLKLPFFAKASLLLIGSYALISMLYIGKGIIVPLIFAVIISIVLHPVVSFLVSKKVNRVLAIFITLILAFLFLATFGVFIFSQAMGFSESWPKIVEKFTDIFNQTINLASGYFDISPEKINAWITKSEGDFINTSGSTIGQTLANVGSGLVILFIIPVYIFMLMFYSPLLLEFIRRVFGATNRSEVSQIISQIKTVIQRYLTGLAIEAVLVATLNSVGLLILGIQYAILIGIIGAIVNVIPYIGGIVAVALPMMIALATKSSPWFALYVLGIYYLIQLIDNHYIIPFIVASKVKINALVSIIVVLAFGALWGLPGMFLSIPLTAIIKVVFDHIDPLKPWGFLLGDTMPVIELFKLKLGKNERKNKEVEPAT